MLRYIAGTTKYGIYFTSFGTENLNLQEFSNALWVDNCENKKSIDKYLFTLAKESISWKFNK